MRVLLLEHPQMTYGTWQLWQGLNRLLGWQSVVEFPYHSDYHGRGPLVLDSVKWYRDVLADIESGKPLPRGIPPLQPGERLTTHDQREIPSFGFYANFFEPSPQREHTEEEIVDTIESFDVIVLGNSHRVPTVALGRLRDKCKRLPPIVYTDFGERDEFNAHWWHVFRPEICFKQSLTPEEFAKFPSVQVPCKLWPLPLSNSWMGWEGCAPVVKSLGNQTVGGRCIDVFCALSPGSWHERVEVIGCVQECAKRYGLSSLHSRLAWFNQDGPAAGLPYFAIVAASRIAISMRGSTRDAARYWELLAFGPCLLADGTMGCVHPYPFQDGETAAFYRSLDQLEQQIVHLHTQSGQAEAIASAGLAHARRFHSVEARTLFFLGIIRPRLGLSYDDEQFGRIEAMRRKLGWDSEVPEWQTGPVVGYGQADRHVRLDYSGPDRI